MEGTGGMNRRLHWSVHNWIGHPLSDAAYWVVLAVTRWESAAKVASDEVHDATLPPEADHG